MSSSDDLPQLTRLLREGLQALADPDVDELPPLTMRRAGEAMRRFLLEYEFGLAEVQTKLDVLRQEFLHMHDYNPIEHISTRVKTPESIVEKIGRRGVEPTLASIRENITDIAGARVTCSFVEDVYRLFDLLVSQDDITLLAVKDYIAKPKPSGYKSLHAVVQVPVFLSTGTVKVTVEIQFRTIAMDFWASLEHKIHYKFDGNPPEGIAKELSEAAAVASALDWKMAALHRRVHGSLDDD